MTWRSSNVILATAASARFIESSIPGIIMKLGDGHAQIAAARKMIERIIIICFTAAVSYKRTGVRTPNSAWSP